MIPTQILNINILGECQDDDECPDTKRCKNYECQDPCLDIICGTRATCAAESHRPLCKCPPGLEGDPFEACTEVGCTSNFECADNEKCDYLTSSSNRKECQPLCRHNPCASGASCSASNHKEICTCSYPLQGDGYVSCTECKLTLYSIVISSNFALPKNLFDQSKVRVYFL